ncbi:hypothetical protein HF086_017657 [Spodoptera exigua]|uniref:Tc1-like transposase DDE domain-containing protein n=1 Tax=Spodoptera exigua TaxID=7107 RepID=A0A922SJQ3_SPOEX|nr:hypothetical protein HF086_017657 [Spodoptera exigua]
MGGKTLHSQARTLALKVLKYFEDEKSNKTYLIPVDKALKRACAATGISKATLLRIKNEAKKVPIISPDDDTVEPSPREKTTLRRILVNYLGYKFKKCKNARRVLMQKPDIAAWRARYLRRKKENSELGADKKPVIYLDETWIHSHYTVRKCWQNNNDASIKRNENPGQRWILVHAGGENGLVVIDNAPYHSTQSEKPPVSSSLKGEMQSWLRKNKIPFQENMTKPELYHLIVVNKPPKLYIVDELLREHGHEVLRLPPYHCDLNPIEYIWNLIKQRVAAKNVNQYEKEIEGLTRQAIQSITASDWKKEVNHIERLEKEYWEKDRLGEMHQREFIISFGGEETSSSESESESENEDMMDGIEAISYSDNE